MAHPQLVGPTVADTDIIGLKVIGLKQVSDERGTIVSSTGRVPGKRLACPTWGPGFN